MNQPWIRKASTRGDWTKENQFPLPNPKLVGKSSTCLLGHKHDGNDGTGGTVKNMMGEDKDLPPRVYIHDCYRASPGLSCHDCTSQAGPFQGSYGQPRETTRHLLGPIWATFRPTIFTFHYVAPQLFIFRRTVQIAPNFINWNVHIFLFWLNPKAQSKFHNTSNYPPPATDSGWTARTPLYQPVQAVPPYSLPFFPVSRTEEPAKASTCARDRRAVQQLALKVHVKHSDLTWPVIHNYS